MAQLDVLLSLEGLAKVPMILELKAEKRLACAVSPGVTNIGPVQGDLNGSFAVLAIR